MHYFDELISCLSPGGAHFLVFSRSDKLKLTDTFRTKRQWWPTNFYF